MEIWNEQLCKTTYGNHAPGGITSHMLCAGQKGKDSCSVSIRIHSFRESIASFTGFSSGATYFGGGIFQMFPPLIMSVDVFLTGR